MNRINLLFDKKNKNIFSVFCTAGYPQLDKTVSILENLEKSGVDMIEIGMPFSDPTADGPVIQKSNTIAIENGMNIETLFNQIKGIRKTISIPLILMGYINPAMQYGFERFLEMAANCGIDGLIIPDLPLHEYEFFYKEMFEKYKLKCIFLITPQTSEERIRKIDDLSNAFIYVVSTQSITGGSGGFENEQALYFKRLKEMNLKNPCIVGFGIKDKATFEMACSHLNGAIIGSAFINTIENSTDLDTDILNFTKKIIQN